MLCYSTNGDNWLNNTGWLTDPNECNWYNAWEPFCSSDGVVNQLILESNNLVGKFLIHLVSDYFIFPIHFNTFILSNAI